MDDVMNKLIDRHLQEEEDTAETLKLAYQELDPDIFKNEDVHELLCTALEIGIKNVFLVEPSELAIQNISEKLLLTLSIEDMVEMNLTTIDRVIEEYYNQP